MTSLAAIFRLPSLVDPVSLENMTDPIRFNPCHHIVDITTADHFPIPTGRCPLCYSPILEKVRDVTIGRIIGLLQQINRYSKGSQEQINLSYDLGRCILSPLISSNNVFDKPIKLVPCGHVIEESLAERVTICPLMFCKKDIESRYKEFNLKGLVDEVCKVIHEIRFDSRVAKKEVIGGHFDNDASLLELAEGILARKGIVEKLTIEDHSSVTDAGFISFIEQFAGTIKEVSITFDPRGISKKVFSYLQSIELDSLSLIGSRSLVDENVVGLISNMKLNSLNLRGCGITREYLPHLKKMTSLRSLALDRSSFNQSELAELQAALAETRFNILLL